MRALKRLLNNLDDLDYIYPVFLLRQGEYESISRSLAYRVINKACKAVGVPGKIGTYTLRKTWGY